MKNDNKLNTIKLMKFRCKKCDNEFLTNAPAENCVMCGTQLTEDSYLRTTEVIDKNDFQNKLNDICESFKNLQPEENISIVTYIMDFIKDKNIDVPVGASVNINLKWEYDNNPWQYLESVRFDFDFEDKENIEIELKESIDNMFSIGDMAENSKIILS